MLVMTRRDNDPSERRRLLVLGVVFLAVLVSLCALSVAIYNKVFTTVTWVTLEADRAGLQLDTFGDVRVNGALVGQVREISQEGDKAYIKLGLEPAAARNIPANVEANIIPTTLFGQKYVALMAPEDAAEESLADGDLIPAGRVHTSTELSKVLTDLDSLLGALRPSDLATTLTALATALNGRGAQLGETFDDLDSYLTAMNPHLPALQENLRLLDDVARSYQVATPDLVTVLDNSTAISGTVVDQQDRLEALFTDVSGVSVTATRVLAANEQNLIRFGQVTRPAVALLAKYAPQYPCLFKGFEEYRPRLREIFEPGTILQAIEIGSQRRAYDERDRPVYEDQRGPRCYGLPYDPIKPWQPIDLANGTDLDSGSTGFIAPEAPSGSSETPDLGGLLGLRTSGDLTGTEREQQVVNTVLAMRTGRPIDSFSSLSTLLYGPVIRGTEVDL